MPWASNLGTDVLRRTGSALGFHDGAWIGLVIYTIPYAFIVVLITMGRYQRPSRPRLRAPAGPRAWRAFWDIEFPQIRPGVA